MKKFCCILITCLLITNLFAQQEVKGLKQIFDITVDDLGNAMIAVSMKLNASQWDMFKKNIGNNSSILKREIEKALPKYYLSDFSYSEAPMDRSYTIKFKALGLASINQNGRWESKLESKNPDITKLSEHEFVMNADFMTNGMLIQQTQKIHLPSGAGDAKIEKDSFGKAVMTYSQSGGMFSWVRILAGIALIAAGVGVYFMNMQGSKNKLRVAGKQPMVA
jgi:hypothetical protein